MVVINRNVRVCGMRVDVKLTCVYSRGSEAIAKYKHTRKVSPKIIHQKLTYSHIRTYKRQGRQNVQNSLSRFMFYTGLYVLAAFVVLVINLTYVDDVCRHIAWLISLISLLFDGLVMFMFTHDRSFC